MLDGSSPDPPIDTDGHGTHTASTAAGNFLPNASYYGLAGGTAAGIAPHAHLAIYKVCTSAGCSISDVLAGIDAAVGDGVDVISISIDKDPLAIGAFGAVTKGIFVSCAAGNSGPVERTLSNEAPWLLTVAASTVDRSQRATVKLGDGQKFNGESLDQYPTSSGSLLTLFHTTKPTVSITYDGTVIGTSPAPVVAFFSSRGPSTNGPGILKPDVSGPGVNILAAWPSDVEVDSGTSMATPHLSGVAALLKSLHPGWSPAAIKSAIMTASDDKDRDGNQIMDQQHTTAGFFAMGAGHVNPSKAADPGLVYDLGIDDYIAYVCGKFGNTGARVIVRDTTVDCGKINNITESELNYPSIVVAPKNGTAATVKRTVTNVGQANSRYTVDVEVPTTVSVTVSPPSLSFSEVNQKKSFLVTAKWTTAGLPTRNAEANLKWVSDTRVVRSPLVVSIL
ncbi:Peptidase inhibitor I9 [Musa troglodytarum]|uniref:Peptidase inhibitor I9 n=1 Tax=Musa troglodytarum TaxID=320322 RepID=A0A9E7EQV3_9LILI|nr:Peptidase inhibitor I9 [Musa troglodytarum]